jgi:hypothetical protein
MIFLREARQHESVEAPILAATESHAPTARVRAPNPILIATAPELKIVVTHSKQTTTPCPNRYFFGTFRAAHDLRPILALRTARA